MTWMFKWPEWSNGFPYFLQFKSEFSNKEFMIWTTVCSQSCFCWLFRAFPSLAAKNVSNLVWVLAEVWWLLNGRYSFLPEFPQGSPSVVTCNQWWLAISGDLQSLLTVTSFLYWYEWKYPFSHSAWPQMNRYLEKDFVIQSYDKVISLSSDHMLSDHMTRQPKGRGPYVQ